MMMMQRQDDTSLQHEVDSQSEDDDNEEMRVVRTVARLLPKHAKCESNKLQVDMHSIQDVKSFVRAMFRINNVRIDPVESSDLRNEEMNQKRRDIAFDKLRKLNELHKQRILPLKERHIRNADRTGIMYRIGEVVQHRSDRWRGVIASWERGRNTSSISDDFGSLTKKSYDTKMSSTGTDSIRYTVILDVGDAFTLTNVMAAGGSTIHATQTELESVTDEHLTRIRNDRIDEAFVRFDLASHSFVANEILRYEFPADQQPVMVEPTKAVIDLCDEVTAGVKAVAEQLDAMLLQTMKEKVNNYSLLTNSTTTLWRILKRIAKGDVYPEGTDPEDLASTSVAAMHVRSLMDVLGRITEAMYQRRISLEKLDMMQFQVGDVVRHKKYGFRGVVVAWDSTPSVDVSNWDGVRDIENVMEQPFYTVVPDKEDCIEAFGGERNLRYVCQANLEPCPADQRMLNVDLGHGWESPLSSEATKYIPPIGLSFAYGNSLHDEEKEMEANMGLMEKAVNDVYISARSNGSGGLSLQNLSELLQKTENLDDAAVVQDAIKEIRKASSNLELRTRLDQGVTALVAGKQAAAMEIYESVIAEDPSYADAWNKIGTCRLVASDHIGATEAFEKVLELDDTNYQAMASMGLISSGQKDYKTAVEWFRKCLALDPWSMTSTRLSACVDLLARETSE